MQIKFKVDQADITRIMKRANRYGRNVAKEIDQATAYAAFDVQREAKTLVPVKTGRLRASIDVQKVGGAVSIARSLRGRAALITYRVGTNVNYAKNVEFGTQRQRPQPFLRPAYNIVIPDYKRNIIRILRTAKG